MHLRASSVLPFLVLHLAQASPLNPKIHHIATNLSFNGHASCTDRPDWVGDGYVDEHCAHAIANLYHGDFYEHHFEPFEFLAPGARAVYGIPAMRTPRRYTVGTCTVVIGMLATLPWGVLPHEEPRYPYGGSDVSNFGRLWAAASDIWFRCLIGEQSLGWVVDGDLNHGIGIFIFSTRSGMNGRFVRGGNFRELNLTDHMPTISLKVEGEDVKKAGTHV